MVGEPPRPRQHARLVGADRVVVGGDRAVQPGAELGQQGVEQGLGAAIQRPAAQDRLARLKTYSKESAEFEALSQRLTAAVPATSDVYDYITALSNAAAATGVDVTSVSPSSAVTGGNVAVVPVSLSVSGSYDQTLAFIKALYALPRLTIITQVSLTGGGNGTARSTGLTSEFSLYILAQTSALAGSTPTTTG